MSQQKYIYPPTTIEQLQALYSNPQVVDGFTTTEKELSDRGLLYDRAITDILNLPYTVDELIITPNELATSTSIHTIVDKIQQNFLYLNSRATIASNALPGHFNGYYTVNATNAPVFYKNTTTTPVQIPVLKNIGYVVYDEDQKKISDAPDGESLNQLTSGIWLRDNSILDSQTIGSATETFQYGFLADATSITVVKMSRNPENNTAVTDINTGKFSGSKGWAVINRYETILDIPNDKNALKFTNISKIKSDYDKNIYVLDSGVSRPGTGVAGVSDSSTRGMIYKYNVSGYLDVETNNTITKDKRQLIYILGDLNKKTTENDIINPATFTTDTNNNIIVYDEYDYTFKIFDANGNFVDKKPKRNTFFRGAVGTTKQYMGVTDIHYDSEKLHLYVLTPTGFIFVFDSEFKLISKIILDKNNSNQSRSLGPGDMKHLHFRPGYPGSSNNERFIQLEFSKNEPNVYYVLTTNRVIKRFKTRPDYSVGVYNLLDNNIGLHAQTISPAAIGYRVLPKFINICQDAHVVSKNLVNSDNEVVTVVDSNRSYTYDQLYMYCGFLDITRTTKVFNYNDLDIDINFIISFQERLNYRSSLVSRNYDIYDVDGIKSVNHREYNSDFNYNKLLHKLLNNHTKLIELLHYRLAASYISTGDLVYDRQIYLDEKEHRGLILKLTDDYRVGINEYYTTAVVNRCIRYIYDIQLKVLNILQTVELNSWPGIDTDVPLEPYTYTPGGEYLDQDGLNYQGYYYIRTQTDGDIYVSGRNSTDGTTNANGTPTTDRYLEPVQ